MDLVREERSAAVSSSPWCLNRELDRVSLAQASGARQRGRDPDLERIERPPDAVELAARRRGGSRSEELWLWEDNEQVASVFSPSASFACSSHLSRCLCHCCSCSPVDCPSCSPRFPPKTCNACGLFAMVEVRGSGFGEGKMMG